MANFAINRELREAQSIAICQTPCPGKGNGRGRARIRLSEGGAPTGWVPPLVLPDKRKQFARVLYSVYTVRAMCNLCCIYTATYTASTVYTVCIPRLHIFCGKIFKSRNLFFVTFSKIYQNNGYVCNEPPELYLIIFSWQLQ